MRDARNHKNSVDYISIIVLNSKNTNIVTTNETQVLLIYKYIDDELRRDLLRPTFVFTVASLLKKLRYQKNI